MRSIYLKVTVKTAILAVTILLLASLSSAQSVDLAVSRTTTTLPDGQVVQMWGYSCTGASGAGVSCTPLSTASGWAPPLIVVPSGTPTFTINLTNSLPVPTSLVIVGQLGGGLGSNPRPSRADNSPDHSGLVSNTATWPIAGDAPSFAPPPQGSRVRSFGTEVGPAASGALQWSNLKAGTYLIESGTHPSIQGPMGLYGVLVVTDATTSTAYAGPPAVIYDTDRVVLLSEIDAVQNNEVDLDVATSGFVETRVWNATCGAAHTCYPAAVNFDPRYYTINGRSFDKTAPSASQLTNIPATPAVSGVLLRLVNAGLRMHVPAVVGLDMTLIAEDGNQLPGTPRVQSEVFMAAGKTYDVKVTPASTVGAGYAAGTFAIFDRALSLSTNNSRDGGMIAHLLVNGGTAPAGAPVSANNATYYCNAGVTLTVSDPSKGVLANATGANGAVLGTVTLVNPTTDSLAFNSDGTFTYTQPSTNTTCGGSFNYLVNGTLTATATITQCDAGSGCSALGGVPTAVADIFPASNVASTQHVSPPGVLANDTDPDKHPLTAVYGTGCIAPTPASTLLSAAQAGLNADGSFTATSGAAGNYYFCYRAVNSQKTQSNVVSAQVTFPTASGLVVNVVDGLSKTPITDYRWIIEEDRTFHIDATQVYGCTPVPPARTCTPPAVPANAPSLGTSFHTSYMPVVASGCVGTLACEAGQTVLDNNGNHVSAVCDVGNGTCRPGGQQNPVAPSQVHLDPTKHYFISVLPGDGANGFNAGNSSAPTPDCFLPDPVTGDPPACGHTMGGSQIGPGQTSVTVNVEATPLPTAKIAVFVFQDDWPLNGESDAGGGVDTLATQETGLGGFEITILDQAGGFGDSTGQPTYDMFNMPLSNALAGMPDPLTGNDACPITKQQDGLVGMIVTCPHFESDGVTPSPLEGQALVANLYPGLYEVVATPGADRIGRGEEWLQTNTLDGTKSHEAFVKAGEPAYFQEFGPAGYHVSIGFANPAIINGRRAEICASAAGGCSNTVQGKVTTARISRSPDERIYSSGTGDANSFTNCYVSLGDPDEEDFAFTKCDSEGNFSFPHMIPDGNWRITVFDQWNDLLVDGLSTPVAVGPNHRTATMEIPMQQWRTNLSTRTFFDQNGDGVFQDGEPGLPLVPVNIRYRDGSFAGFNNTDLAGAAGFNEIFPYFNWLVLEADTTRYKQTGVHVVYDAGGPVDTTGVAAFVASSVEANHLPTNLRVPGGVYCSDADCSTQTRLTHPNGGGPGGSTGRIDPPSVTTEGWQGFLGNTEILEFGKKPFEPGENGGIKGHVIYMSTRPFDDPALLLQLSWTPAVPNVTINLYQEGAAPDGTKSLKQVDTTKTTSWDDWAQGFRSDGIPNMNCPGQDATSPFFFTLRGSTQWLDPATPKTALPNNSQFKCYDGMHLFNQVQPAPYDGMYKFPSVTSTSPATGLPTGTNCTICINNPTGDGTKMLPAGKYVVEVVIPPGYELVKEEDKNILIGDDYIAPVAQQFGGLGSVFIMPDQAAVASRYNPNNVLNPTTDLGVQPRHEGDTGSVETFWPCVGQARVVPDYISLFPQSSEVAPFAGATRNLCDRKEVTLEDQMQVLAKFYVFSSTHIAAHFTGIITDDFSSEFDPFSPQFGEKFAVPNLPISFKDFNGVEISRTYSDQWGFFDGLNYSTWEVNPPNPTGYAPTMMVACMNDPGPIVDTRPGSPTIGQLITDPLFNSNYSQFCYEWAFMPGQTAYMDTPVVPTTAFAEAYNPVDCAYPNATPAIKEVDGDGIGPWVSAGGHTLTITALGDQIVLNNAYSGPSATAAPYNQQKITRHYGFGPAPAGGCSNGNPNAACPSVTVGGIPLHGVSWSDTTITGQVQGNVPLCAVQQRGTGNGGARCGELVITAANGKKSIDTVTVTIGGKAPTRLAPGRTIQSAIDAALPGDLILVPPGTYNEMLLMWKPVRLQGVAAASVTVNANTHPAGKMDVWRRQVNCLFGLALNGNFSSAQNPYDPTGTYTCSLNGAQVDPIPLEPLIGWNANLNGNLAEFLQEPTLMGAYEGAGITVLGKGLSNPNTPGVCDGLNSNGCIVLTTSDCSNSLTSTNPNSRSNFLCNPSRVDGITFTNSSGGGGGIFLHGWNHNTEVSNNRVYANIGTLTGGITIGQMETPDATIVGTQQQAFGFNRSVNVHHNSITQNASIGDELNSTTPAAAGGVTFCTGADSYSFNRNWVCGNLSSGDGGGFAHFGLSYNGNISNNWFLFNQSFNPTIPTYGGGVLVAGAPPDGPVCEANAVVDQDCPPQLSDGTGSDLVIDSNLILGNSAESGSGGGLRLQGVNGNEVARNNNSSTNWYSVTVTNNIIANNVAGWDGGGVSLQDALRVNFINNTVADNDTTASSGVLFNTLGAANGNVPPPAAGSGNGSGCTPQPDPSRPQDPSCINPITTSTNQPAGLVAIRNTSNLIASLNGLSVTCPAGYPTLTGPNATCRQVSYPVLRNDLFWRNRPFHIEVGNFGSGLLNQQHLVSLLPTLNQSATGACPSGANYWDIGVRGDTGATNHASGFTLNPTNSILTSLAGGYSGNGNIAPTSAGLVSPYCNGSRVPPENPQSGPTGYGTNPGISDATVPNPVFNLTPAATVDEGNNWVNMSYGPLTLSHPVSGATIGDYSITGTSLAINNATGAGAPNHDFFGAPRPQGGRFDIGAVEFAGPIAPAPTLTSIVPTSGARGTAVPVTLTGTNLTGATAVNVSGTGVTVSGITATATTVTATFTITGTAALGARTVSVTTPGGTSNTVTFTVTAPQGTLSFASATNGTLTTVAGVRALTFTIPTPRAPVTSVVTVTNTGTAPLQITAENLLVNIGGLYSVTANTCSFTIPLAIGGTCTFSVRYATPATLPGTNDVGALAVRNNGTGTIPIPAPPYTPLALVAR